MALRRVLPSRVNLPEGGSPGAPPETAAQATPPAAQVQPPAAAPQGNSAAALGSLMADLPSPQPAVQPQPQVAVPEPSQAAPPPQVSRPDDDNPLRRRPKKPRSFTAAPQEETPETADQAVPAAQPAAAPPPVVGASLADAAPLAQVDERLQASGILPSPPADVLTQNVPPSLPEQPAGQPEAPVVAVPAPTQGPQSAIQAPPERHPGALEAPSSAIVPPEPELVLVNDLAPPPADQALTRAAVPEEAPPAPPAPEAFSLATQSFSAPAESVPPLAPAPVTSDVPWATPISAPLGAAPASNGWEVPLPPSPEATVVAPPSPAPMPDVYGALAAPGASPFAPARGGLPAPEITGQRPRSQGGGGWQVLAAGAVVAVVLFGAYRLVMQDATPTPTSLAESLRNTPAAEQGEQLAALPPQGALLPPPDAATADTPFMPVAGSLTTVVDFTDVPPSEAGRPIVADGTEQMPDDVGFMARLQSAIAEEKMKKEGSSALGQAEKAVPAAQTAALSKEEKLLQGEDLKAQLQDELAEYRKALLDAPTPALAPKPGEFFKSEGKKYMGESTTPATEALDAEGAPVQTAQGALLPPPQLSGGRAVPPQELYRNNPANLPIIPEPATAAEPKVRQLSDFDVAMFGTEKDRVRIPKGIKPRFSTTDFPELDVLSFVPGKGLIAYHNGQEGVLLLGESIDGWELVAVNPDTAEFKNGQRSQYVSAE